MTVRAITGTTTSSISTVDATIRWPCCAATAPDGCKSTMLQPASRKAGRAHRTRASFKVDMPKYAGDSIGAHSGLAHNLGPAAAHGHWTFCPIAATLAECDATRCRTDFRSSPDAPIMSNTHQDALPQHIPGHDARHGS